MTPARMGSQRLAKKNLRLLNGIPLVTRALKKCKDSGCFDEVWLNSEDSILREYANSENCNFYQRPLELASNTATSEDFIADFFQKHECDYLVQVHSIAPLLTLSSIQSFVAYLKANKPDCLLAVEPIQLECVFQNEPINFRLDCKTNSQELIPVNKISWSLSSWHRPTFLEAIGSGQCATYAGRIDYFQVNHLAGHVIKTEEDLQIAELLLPLVENL